MTTLLRIDSSSRHEGSWSRRFGDELVAHLSPTRVVTRDLAEMPVGHITPATINAFFSDPSTHGAQEAAATALSDQLIAEIEAADEILITVPMYNFGIPSALKAWVDQIVRVGRTFSFDGQTFGGLVTGKRAFVVVAYGAAGYAGDMRAADFVAPYLRFVLNFLGIADVTVIPVEGINTGQGDAAEAAARAAIGAISVTQGA
ncbi:MAG: FMN-dependent NADH-azoreductase [Pseudomonadota bacterium]